MLFKNFSKKRRSKKKEKKKKKRVEKQEKKMDKKEWRNFFSYFAFEFVFELFLLLLPLIGIWKRKEKSELWTTFLASCYFFLVFLVASCVLRVSSRYFFLLSLFGSSPSFVCSTFFFFFFFFLLLFAILRVFLLLLATFSYQRPSAWGGWRALWASAAAERFAARSWNDGAESPRREEAKIRQPFPRKRKRQSKKGDQMLSCYYDIIILHCDVVCR